MWNKKPDHATYLQKKLKCAIRFSNSRIPIKNSSDIEFQMLFFSALSTEFIVV